MSAEGDLTYETWTAELMSVDSPILDEGVAAYEAACPMVALCLATMKAATNYGVNALAEHNPFNETARGSFPGLINYPSWTDALLTWQPVFTGNDPQLIAAAEALKVKEVQTVQTFTTEIPGLPGGPLITEYPIKLKILPASQTRNRPGIKARLPRVSVQHGNGNPNSSAAGEATYLYNGAGGRQASYHSAGDDKEIWVMIPADEVTWQAADGDGPGNMNGFSCEMVEDAALWTNSTRRDNVIRICADFMGRVAARLSIEKPQQHWDFNWVIACDSPCNTKHPQRNDCPNKLRYVLINGRLAWDIYVQQWQAAKVSEITRMGVKDIYPEGMNRDLAEKWFGPKFNENGKVSQLWLKEGIYAKYIGVEKYDTRSYWLFEGGLIFWKPSDNEEIRRLGVKTN